MKVDMSPKAVSRRLRKVGELVRVCRALAGPRRKKPRLSPSPPSDEESGVMKGCDAHNQS